MAEIMTDYITKSTRPSRFFTCNIEKHGKAWERGYSMGLTIAIIRIVTSVNEPNSQSLNYAIKNPSYGTSITIAL